MIKIYKPKRHKNQVNNYLLFVLSKLFKNLRMTQFDENRIQIVTISIIILMYINKNEINKDSIHCQSVTKKPNTIVVAHLNRPKLSHARAIFAMEISKI